MKPLMLHGHERSITQIKYNREGDLIFSAAKDPQPNVWYSLNGERLGTFIGHNGAVWCIDSNWDTTKVITGAADNTCKIWDCETGRQMNSIETRTAVRTNGFSYSGNLLFLSTDKTMGFPCELQVFDQRDPGQIVDNAPMLTIPIDTKTAKITAAIWGPGDDYIMTGHDNGEINQWDIKTGKRIKGCRDCEGQINDLQPYKDQTMFIAASRDKTARLFDMDSLEPLKLYQTERPVNSASISPTHDHVVLGGGQDAMSVTTTSTRIGKFDARFFHMVFEEEFGRVKGHFGPINSVAFHPDGKSYSSGGEDGYVRVHNFDNNYNEFIFEY